MDLRLEGSVNKGHKEERSRSARRTSAAILAACGAFYSGSCMRASEKSPFYSPFYSLE
jgi:hypothetical protein